MGDDKTKRGNPDNKLVSTTEGYEIKSMAKKTGMPAPLVKKIAEQVGPSAAKVEAKLHTMKRNGKR